VVKKQKKTINNPNLPNVTIWGRYCKPYPQKMCFIGFYHTPNHSKTLGTQGSGLSMTPAKWRCVKAALSVSVVVSVAA
jgi:hypothetical protein